MCTSFQLFIHHSLWFLFEFIQDAQNKPRRIYSLEMAIHIYFIFKWAQIRSATFVLIGCVCHLVNFGQSWLPSGKETSWIILMCLCKVEWTPKAFWQMAHLNFFSSAWTQAMCRLRVFLPWNLDGHNLQWTGLILSWTNLTWLVK